MINTTITIESWKQQQTLSDFGSIGTHGSTSKENKNLIFIDCCLSAAYINL